jgi:hypothetical protein
MSKLNNEEKEFVKRVAQDSVKGTLDIDEIRKAFKLIMDIEPEGMSPNIRIMRNELYRFNEKALNDDKPLPDHLNPDFDIMQELPTEPMVTPSIVPSVAPSVLPKIEENTVVDKRSKAYRDFKKNQGL